MLSSFEFLIYINACGLFLEDNLHSRVKMCDYAEDSCINMDFITTASAMRYTQFNSTIITYTQKYKVLNLRLYNNAAARNVFSGVPLKTSLRKVSYF